MVEQSLLKGTWVPFLVGLPSSLPPGGPLGGISDKDIPPNFLTSDQEASRDVSPTGLPVREALVSEGGPRAGSTPPSEVWEPSADITGLFRGRGRPA